MNEYRSVWYVKFVSSIDKVPEIEKYINSLKGTKVLVILEEGELSGYGIKNL